MKRYKFAKGCPAAGLDVEKVGETLESLAARFGYLEPALVVREARAVESPLHAAFEWDDKRAGEQFRLQQARYLIREVRVVTEQGEESIEQRVFVNVTTENHRGYMPVVQVMSDEVLREQVLNKAKNDLLSWRERYKDLQELARIYDVIEEVVMGSSAGHHALPMAAKGR